MVGDRVAEDTTTVSFGVKMEDGVSGPADSAASALAELKKEIDADTAAIANMQKAMKALKAPNDASIKQFQSQLKALGKETPENAAKIKSLKASIEELMSVKAPNGAEIKRLGDEITRAQDRVAANTAKHVGLGGGYAKEAKTQKPKQSSKPELVKPPDNAPLYAKLTYHIKKMSDVTDGLSKGGGPMASLAGWLTKLPALLSNPVVIAGALAAALVAIGFAAGKAIVSLARFAIASANARKAQLLQLEGLTRIRTALTMTYGIGADKATDLQKVIDQVSASVSISRDKVAGYAKELYLAGARGDKLASALRGTAIVASAAGEEQAGAFKQFAGAVALTGGNVDRLTDRVKNQFGGVVRAKMNDLNVQAEKLKESQESLFDEVDISGYQKAERGLNEMWSSQTNAGKALRTLLAQVVQPLVDGATVAKRALKWLFQEAIIEALQLEIAYLGIRNAIRSAFRGDWTGYFDNLITGIKNLAKSLSGVGGGFALLLAPILGPLVALGVAFTTISSAIGSLVHTDWAQLGQAIKVGLLMPLREVGEYFLNLGKDIKTKFAQAIEAHSPSKVFEQFGKDIALGLKIGVDSNADQAQGSVAAAAAAPALAGARGGGGGGGAGPVSIGEIVINMGGAGGNARELAESVKRELERVLQGVALQLGAPAPAGGGGAT